MLSCPDPRQLYLYTDLKVACKMSLVYREAEAVGVYDAKGKPVNVDDLPETLYAGSAVIADVSLN